MTATDGEKLVAVLTVEHRALTPRAAVQILKAARDDTSKSVIDMLRSTVPENLLLAAIAEELGFRFVDLNSSTLDLSFDDSLFDVVDMDQLKAAGALPLRAPDNTVVIALVNPTNTDVVAYLSRKYQQTVSVVLASTSQVQAKLALTSSSATVANEEFASDTNTDVAASLPSAIGPVNALVAWVDGILESAVAQGASDIHFGFNIDKSVLVRMRIDGILRPQKAPPKGREKEVIGIVMNKSDLDAGNYMEPQSGKFSMHVAGRQVDVRVEMLPMANGPTVVMRLLDSDNVRKRLDDMGFSVEQLDAMRSAVKAPQGTVLICGPTGSGKTTTLYALLREVASMEKNTVTVEDPVEYRIPLVMQTQVRNIGDKALTFGRALRSILRLDPDIILVGEIRDGETARIAMEASITGHMVLSTVHADSALGIYTRLVELGTPRYMVSDAVSLAVSQRLLRRLHSCARLGPPTSADVEAFRRLGVSAIPDQLMQPLGCPSCNGSGYQGRIAVVEVLATTPKLRTLINEGASLDDLEEEARLNGFVPMTSEALRHVYERRSTVAEVLRVVQVT